MTVFATAPCQAAAVPTPRCMGTAAQYRAAPTSLSTAQKIALLRQSVKYVFVMFQENRSFDHYFASYPGANGLFDASGNLITGANSGTSQLSPWRPFRRSHPAGDGAKRRLRARRGKAEVLRRRFHQRHGGRPVHRRGADRQPVAFALLNSSETLSCTVDGGAPIVPVSAADPLGYPQGALTVSGQPFSTIAITASAFFAVSNIVATPEPASPPPAAAAPRADLPDDGTPPGFRSSGTPARPLPPLPKA